MNSSRLRQFVSRAVIFSVLLWVGSAPAQSITNPIAQLKNHILGVTNLTAAQIVAEGNSIQANIRQVGTNSVALAAAFDLVATFDNTIGALFVATNTKNGFTRDGAGYELEQALFDLQQGIMDYSYMPANLVTYFSLLNNTKFGTSAYFPGAVTPPASTNTGYAVLINATQPQAWGAPVMYEDYAARRPTGCYLAPGSIAYVTVPAALVNIGYSVRVEAHSWDLSAKTTLKRLDRVSLVYPITSTTTRIANPLGGGIYIEVPYKKTNGIVTVGITNVVRSPFFSATSFHQTTAAEWLVERTNPGKWADFESDKFMMQVPRSWIYNYTNAVNVIQDWDKAMDAVSDLMGLPQVRSKTVLYLQTDVLYRGTANFPGYPQSNDPYNPNTAESGNKDHYFLTGPQNSPWTTLHELGHAQLFTKFTGETESAVNLLDVAAQNQIFGVNLDTAFGESIGDAGSANVTRTQAALSWVLPEKFRAGQPMDDTDMKYQHRGHGKYVDVAGLFGWEALSNFWHSVHVDYMNGIEYPVNSDPTDSRILRMSEAAGVDLRPLIHMWGVHPASPNTLKTNIMNAGLKPSLAIYNRLKYYQSSVPTNLTQFRNHYWIVHGKVSDTDKAWYEDMFNNFTPDIGYASITAMQNIIDLYFPDGPPVTTKWSGATSSLWNTSAINWKSIATGSATNYVDVSPADVVLFDDTLTANPAITLNTTVTPSGVLFSNQTTAYSLTGTGRIAGTGPVTKTGSGSVTLSGAHTVSGGISINAGDLIVTTGGSPMACRFSLPAVSGRVATWLVLRAAIWISILAVWRRAPPRRRCWSVATSTLPA
ncbi:MAG: M60 family metallopeptidase [Verrucomicrobia bacterium]|nr:M60 family metallopeptidase [Verrucomicrobiota bacterium]